MPITSFQKKTLSPQEREKVSALLAEIDRRGLTNKVKELGIKVFDTKKFHTDENGYFVRRDGKKYNPNDPDKIEFIESNARYVALISGRGGGKSAAGAQKALRKIAQGLNGAVLNPVFEDFKDSTWPEFREWIPWENVIPTHKYKGTVGWEPHQPFKLAFVNGTTVICKGLSDPDSARGPNINWLWYDEAGKDETGLAWQIAIASVRVGESPQSWITTTPKGKLHWIYDFFIKEEAEALLAEFKELSDRELVESFFTNVDRNLENLDPGFVVSLKKAYVPGSYLYDQEVLGKFVIEGGTLGDSRWFDNHILPERPKTVIKRIRYYDLAASKPKITGKKKRTDPDETVGTLLSMFDNGEQNAFCIEDQVSGQLEWVDIKDLIIKTAVKDGPTVTIYIEQEPAAGGKNQVAELQLYVKEQLGPAYKVEGHPPEGDKIMRANPWFAEAAAGYFYAVFGTWISGFFDQLNSFPDAPHDDKVDSVSGARQIIAPFISWKKIKFLHIGGNYDEKKKEEDKNEQEN